MQFPLVWRGHQAFASPFSYSYDKRFWTNDKHGPYRIPIWWMKALCTSQSCVVFLQELHQVTWYKDPFDNLSYMQNHPFYPQILFDCCCCMHWTKHSLCKNVTLSGVWHPHLPLKYAIQSSFVIEKVWLYWCKLCCRLRCRISTNEIITVKIVYPWQIFLILICIASLEKFILALTMTYWCKKYFDIDKKLPKKQWYQLLP